MSINSNLIIYQENGLYGLEDCKDQRKKLRDSHITHKFSRA